MKHSPSKQTSSPLNLVRETLTQQTCKLLKAKILNGELTAGIRIWADDLAQDLGVSIAPVKEALLILSGEGLINNIPRRGSVVRAFSVEEMHELYQVRRLLEIEAVDIMFKSKLITDVFVADLKQINRQIKKLSKNGEFKDRQVAFELDWEFHQQFMKNCGQSLLIELYSRLNTQAQIIRYASWNIGPRGDKTYREHDELVGALELRDQVKSRRAIRAHLGSILNDFDQTISEEQHENTLQLNTAGELPDSRRKSR
ncbi:MAG: DNA-binding GntR family transcriptional regulator [Parasphingorhabdus sp.]|jgi:DNA-binding GntR family transcriptional regulator